MKTNITKVTNHYNTESIQIGFIGSVNAIKKRILFHANKCCNSDDWWGKEVNNYWVLLHPNISIQFKAKIKN